MRVEIRHSPSYAVARCFLEPKESIKVQPGAMMAHSTGVQLVAKAEGGILRGIGRMIGGENFFQSTFTAPEAGGWVDIIPEMVGDLFAVSVDPRTDLVITRGSWLANDGDIQVTTDASLSGLFAGEGLAVLRAKGTGTLIGSTYGAIDVHPLKAGEGFTVDTGHLVAWESSVNLRTRKAAGLLNSWKSQEGLVVDVTGPGDVITQTRVPSIPTKENNSNNNFGIGSILGN